MPKNERPQQSRRPQGRQQQQRPQRQPRPDTQRELEPQDAPRDVPREPAPIRKKSPNAVLVAVILVALVAVAVLAFLVLPGACSRMQDGGGDNINVINTEGSSLSQEELIDRAKERYAGTWVISSVTWQGEEGDGSLIPQQVQVNVDGTCTITQGGVEYSGQWEIDGDSLYVNAQAGDGSSVTKVLSIDDTSLNISTNNGTGVYVRTAKPDLAKDDSSEQ